MQSYNLPQSAFILLLVLVTLAFLAILAPYGGAVFWATVLAIVFAPIHDRLLRATGGRPNCAAVLAVALVTLILIVPVAMIAASLLDQAAQLYASTEIRESDFDTAYQGLVDILPSWAAPMLERFEQTITATLPEKLGGIVAQIGKAAGRYAVEAASNAFHIAVSGAVMLYLLFFLFRDGRALALRIKQAVPLSARHKRRLFARFTTVIRATVRGNVLVAIVQGSLGGLIFWLLDIPGPLLWAVVMTFLSLIPAIGAAAIWAPTSAFLLLVGAVWEGATLALFGALVIGLVDNVLRPVLVGKDTKLPDYMVLLSTLGGMALFGFNGFVIGPVIAVLFVATWELLAASAQSYRL